MTRRQSNNQRRGGIAAHPAPKNSESKNPLEISRLDFLGSSRHPPHWLTSKGPNYQCGALLVSAGTNEGYFGGKTPREVHQGSVFLERQCPNSSGTFNPEETGLPGLPVSWSHTLFSESGTVGLTPIPWTEKILKDRHFSSDAESLLPRWHLWTDKIWILFSGLLKLEQRVKKFIELRGKYAE